MVNPEFQPSSEPASPEQLQAVYDPARQWLIEHGMAEPDVNPFGNQGWYRDGDEDLPILEVGDNLATVVYAEAVHAMLPEAAAALELGSQELTLYFCPRFAMKYQDPEGNVQYIPTEPKVIVDIPKAEFSPYTREGLLLIVRRDGTIDSERQPEVEGVGLVDMTDWDEASRKMSVTEQRALLDIVVRLDALAAWAQ